MSAPPARAKQIDRITVCGSDGCTSIRPARAVDRRLFDDSFVAAPRRRAPFFTIVVGFGNGRGRIFHSERLVYVPAMRMVATGTRSLRWTRARGARLSTFRSLVAGHEPYAARRMPL
jgi:hypothetical protein